MLGSLVTLAGRGNDTVIVSDIVLNVAPTLVQIQNLIGSTILVVVAGFTTWSQPSGMVVVPCVAFADGTQPPVNPTPNPGATRLWQLALMRAGAPAGGGLINQGLPLPSLSNSLAGSVVIASGDHDFMTAAKNLLPPPPPISP
jgi:hypothetical protein